MSRFFLTIIDQPDGRVSVHSTLDNPVDTDKGPQTPAEHLAVGLVNLINKVLKPPEDNPTTEDGEEEEEITAV